MQNHPFAHQTDVSFAWTPNCWTKAIHHVTAQLLYERVKADRSCLTEKLPFLPHRTKNKSDKQMRTHHPEASPLHATNSHSSRTRMRSLRNACHPLDGLHHASRAFVPRTCVSEESNGEHHNPSILCRIVCKRTPHHDPTYPAISQNQNVTS